MTDASVVGAPRARQVRAERILDAARELILRWGLKRVTVDDIAEHAGIGKGTVYLHWKNRESLFRAVLVRATLEIVEELETAVRADPETALPHNLMREVYLAAASRPLMQAMLVADREMLGSFVDDEVARQAHERVAAGRESIEVALEQGILRQDLSSEDLKFTMRSVVGGFFVSSSHDTDDLPAPERRGDLLALAVQRAVENPDPPAPEVIAKLAAGTLSFLTAFQDAAGAVLEQAYA
ncbi:MAG: TetR/AcrR family transcriptional regulator [Candidatus Dormibacteraceae bacterium]